MESGNVDNQEGLAQNSRVIQGNTAEFRAGEKHISALRQV